MPSRLRLNPVDELVVLPAFPGVRDLLGGQVARGRCELLPAVRQRASAWHPGWRGAKGGNFEPEWWEPDPVIPCSAVHLFRLRDAYYVPAYGVVISAGGEVMKRAMEEAAYLTPDLLALPHVEKSDEGTFLELGERTIKTVEKAVVTMPWGATRNYGHFVLDCLSGAAVCREIVRATDYQFVFPPLAEWQRRHLQLLEVQPLELDDSICHVADLLFTSCVAHFLWAPNVNCLMTRERQLRNRAVKGRGAVKLYLSRGSRPNRVFLSERQLEDRLGELGFTVIVPETCAVDEQIDLFSRADTVVGCRGAGMANVLYCPPGANVIEIKTPRTGGSWLGYICALIGCNWRPYYTDRVVAEDPPVVGGVRRPELGFSFDVDLEDLVRYVASLEGRPH
jgi:capsular polysaccharide biosynthesis protein